MQASLLLELERKRRLPENQTADSLPACTELGWQVHPCNWVDRVRYHPWRRQAGKGFLLQTKNLGHFILFKVQASTARTILHRLPHVLHEARHLKTSQEPSPEQVGWDRG